MGDDQIAIEINTDALTDSANVRWAWSIALSARKPFREAELRIDSDRDEVPCDQSLIGQLADGFEAQRLVLASPELSLAQLAKRKGRCRT